MQVNYANFHLTNNYKTMALSKLQGRAIEKIYLLNIKHCKVILHRLDMASILTLLKFPFHRLQLLARS